MQQKAEPWYIGVHSGERDMAAALLNKIPAAWFYAPFVF